MAAPAAPEKFVNWITGQPIALFDAIGSVFIAGYPGLVPPPDDPLNPDKFLSQTGWVEISGGGGQIGGRLTLTSNTPIMTANVTGATTLYWTPYISRLMPLWNGSAFEYTDLGGELSQATTDTTKSPAAVAADSNYDIFAWDDAGTFRATRGPAWSSSTSRGTGAGTTELSLVQGVYVNAQDITNGPAAGFGTYLGSVRSNSSSQLNWHYGGFSAGGTAGLFNVWNMYNRRLFVARVGDTDSAWNLAATNVRPSNNSTNKRVSFIVGLQEDMVYSSYGATTGTASTSTAGVGVGLDTTTDRSGFEGDNFVGAVFPLAQNWDNQMLIGFHFYQAMESVHGSGTSSFQGNPNNYTQDMLSLIGFF